ncbi:ATP-binding protein [Sunxiuqinia sp. A32]|uniref:ATP-binding protein n=1 Tax=Sunxiuqinia sp. A32 TaxID=3461496 RepID=UPI0040454A0B
MKKIKVEIPITLLTIIMLVLMVLSGNLVYESLTEIVDSVHKEARPDYKLLLIKDINSDLTEIENTVKLYTISNKRSYLSPYYTLNEEVRSKLIDLQDYAFSGDETKILLDSLSVLARQKLIIWENILTLHISKEDEHETFSDYYEKLDTISVEKDTIHFEEAEKVGFIKRLFGKKPEPPKPVIVDRTEEKETMRQEIAALEKEIADRNLLIASRETALMQKNITVNEALGSIIEELENQEQENLLQKTQEADRLASVTYKRLAMFTIAAVFLMILVLFLFYRDLRKSRAYQRVLKEAKTEAEKLARTKELFVATVSHEMRTPVNAIFGLSEQLLQRGHDPKTQKDLDVIYKSTKHLIDLVNDTFDFTRIENQRIQLEPVDFLLDEVLEKVELFNKESAAVKGINFIIEKEYPDGLVLFGDQGRLKQVLINLVTNAIKFTDTGSVTLNVKNSGSSDVEVLSISVTDTGIGIPKDSRELIFNDFVQLETDANKKARGTGLGLYIVKKLVELLGGGVSLESEINVGTTFHLTIPFRKGNSNKIQNVIRNLSAPRVLKGVTVLIVDDEEFNRHLLKNILSKWKVEFQEAEDGQKALELGEKFDFGLILMDIRMPVLNGIDAAKKFKENGYPAKIIALTANSHVKDFDRYKDVGFDNHLEKPFSEVKLHDVITETMKGTEKPAESTGKPAVKSYEIDLSTLESMSNGDPSFLKEMINIFLKSSKNSIDLIEQSFENSDWQAIADIAHKLAAPVKHMNVTEVHQTVKQLQLIAETNQDEELLKNKFEQLKKEITLLDNQLQEYLEEEIG